MARIRDKQGKICDLLKGTEKVLQEKDWVQGFMWGSADGAFVLTPEKVTKVCLLGAVKLAIELDPDISARYSKGLYFEAVEEALSDAIQSSRFYSNRVITFNDTKGRTKEQVLLMVEKAINQQCPAKK